VANKLIKDSLNSKLLCSKKKKVQTAWGKCCKKIATLSKPIWCLHDVHAEMWSVWRWLYFIYNRFN